MVHRPRYDDWSLPKGKLHRGEHPLAAAVREVREETGVAGVPQRRLPTARYRLADGTPKTVDFWSLRADPGAAGDPEPGEVDDVCWLPVEEAAARLTYPADARVLRAFRPAQYAMALVRHGHAGKRNTHTGPDEARPLDARGRSEAAALGDLLPVTAPRRILAATPLRCRQTVEPLAAALGLPVEADSAFDEPRPGQTADERVARAADRLVELARAAVPAVVCSQGKVIPGTLARLSGDGDGDFRTPKGSGWLLAFDDGRLTGWDLLEPFPG